MIKYLIKFWCSWNFCIFFVFFMAFKHCIFAYFFIFLELSKWLGPRFTIILHFWASAEVCAIWPSNSIINEKTQNVIKWIQAFNPDVGFNEFKGNNFQMAIISEENTPYVFEDFRTYSIIFEGTFGNFCLRCWKLFIIFVDNCYFSTLFAHFFDIILTI